MQVGVRQQRQKALQHAKFVVDGNPQRLKGALQRLGGLDLALRRRHARRQGDVQRVSHQVGEFARGLQVLALQRGGQRGEGRPRGLRAG